LQLKYEILKIIRRNKKKFAYWENWTYTCITCM